MNAIKRTCALLCCLTAGGAAGCLRPGGVDPALLARYQTSILARSPQPRAEGEKLGLMTPAPSRANVTLKTVELEGGVTGVELSLDEAIRMALANNVDIQVVSFDPAVSREQMIQAAAAFDFVVFGSLSHAITDQRSATEVLPAKSHVTPFEIGVKKKTTYGGEVALTGDLTRTSEVSPFVSLPRHYEAVTTLSLTQPLLRGAGRDYNLAQLRLASLAHDVTLSQFRQKVEEVLATVEGTYWALVRARRDLEIVRRLLTLSTETKDKVWLRREKDANAVIISQTRAAVQSRRATVIAAEKTVRDAQDQLARLLSDGQLGLIKKYELIPTTPPAITEVAMNPSDQLVAALLHSPILQQARLAIDAQAINVRVARNETLPALDLTASVGIQGLDRYWYEGLDDMSTGDFLSSSIGLRLEYPIGNRERLSRLRQRRLEKLQGVASLQNAADQVALAVNEIIRRIQSNHQQIGVQHLAVEESQAQLKALEDIENIRGALTPEFLQLKLQTQDQVAQAERAELEATVQFNAALAELYRATGTTLLRNNIEVAAEGIAADVEEVKKAPPAGK